MTGNRRRAWPLTCNLALVACVVLAGSALGSKVVLKDGRELSGKFAFIASLSENPARNAKAGSEKPIPLLVMMCDDELRRTFIPKQRVQQVTEAENREIQEKFVIRQRVPSNGPRVGSVGAIIRVTPFDEYGHRSLEMMTSKGARTFVQGITEVTPYWTKVESLLLDEAPAVLWDQRIATSSIPRETLHRILVRQVDAKKLDDRLKLVRLYVQAERYTDALVELEQIVADFPDRKEELEVARRSLKQQYARRALMEIEARRKAGQHDLVIQLLQKFPTDDVAGETLQAVRQNLTEYSDQFERGKRLLGRLDELIAAIKDQTFQERIQPVREELNQQLGVDTLDRLESFAQFEADDTLQPDERVSLAISGWIVGSDKALRNINVSFSLYSSREKILRYLEARSVVDRKKILAEFASEEGATPQLVSAILQNMAPPSPLPEPVANYAGLYELTVDGIAGQAPVTYYVQLPPAYNPLRKYPVVVTLHGAGTSPLQQIDWWAGAQNDQGLRLGQATRHGYIIIAPAWAEEKQASYRFDADEHAAVLNTLRDACRRLSIDTNRVFLSGHSMGGDAAWDIGAAHPDLWAGVIPIVATSDRYVRHYWENVRYVPMYVVAGELDGTKAANNAKDLDRYLLNNFNITYVEYRGRGHENFSDEIQNIFDWMSRGERDFYLKKFKCNGMRNWDNYFWWVELGDYPEKTIVNPEDWPPERGTRPCRTEAELKGLNSIYVKSGAGRITLWLSPGNFDFAAKAMISVNGAKLSVPGSKIAPSTEILLEDVRTRGDRLHPFWAKVDMPSEKVNVLP